MKKILFFVILNLVLAACSGNHAATNYPTETSGSESETGGSCCN